jgi:hypothetical protein
MYSDIDDILPPSDPLSDSSGSDVGIDETSDDIPLYDIRCKTQEARLLSPFPGDKLPYPETPHQQHFRPRSSSLPITGTPHRQHRTIDNDSQGPTSPSKLSSDIIDITPRRPRTANYAAGQAKRRATMAQKKREREGLVQEGKEVSKVAAELQEEKERLKREQCFDELLAKMKERRYTIAELLDYVFNPRNKHTFDWRWSGFFANQAMVQRILGYWTTSSYSKTARKVVHDWAIGLVERAVGKESRTITKSGLLQKRKMTVNEDFFLKYSLTNLTGRLRELAPKTFKVFDAFSTTTRQKERMTPAWATRKEIVSGAHCVLMFPYSPHHP